MEMRPRGSHVHGRLRPSMARLNLARFHVDSGPPSLFERVRFVFRHPRTLRLHAVHFQQRATEREVPVALLEGFDSTHWDLRTVEVRTDTGKFVKTGWRGRLNGETWWLVLGYNDTVQTAYPSKKSGDGPDIVRSGELHAFVERVNRELMDAERGAAGEAPPSNVDPKEPG